MLKSLILLSALVISLASAGVFDFINNCESIREPNVCAIVYDDENCNEGDWTPLRIMNGQSRSFSLMQSLRNYKYKNDIESLVVRRGCLLRVYLDSGFEDGEFVFAAHHDRDLIVHDLEDNWYYGDILSELRQKFREIRHVIIFQLYYLFCRRKY